MEQMHRGRAEFGVWPLSGDRRQASSNARRGCSLLILTTICAPCGVQYRLILLLPRYTAFPATGFVPVTNHTLAFHIVNDAILHAVLQASPQYLQC